MKIRALISPLTLVLSAVLLAGCNSEESAKEAALSPELEKGKMIVEGRCFACHGQGINGAPIIGNKKMWGKRVAQGTDVLIQHAINGYGLMPVKGGFTELSDEQIGFAVRYMVSQVQE